MLKAVGGWWPGSSLPVSTPAAQAKEQATEEDRGYDFLVQVVEKENQELILSIYRSHQELPWERALLYAVSKGKHVSLVAILDHVNLELKDVVTAVEIAVDLNDPTSLKHCLAYYSRSWTGPTLEPFITKAVRYLDLQCFTTLLEFGQTRKLFSSALLGSLLPEIINTDNQAALEGVLQYSIATGNYIGQNQGLENALVQSARDDRRECLRSLLTYADTNRAFIPLGSEALGRILPFLAKKGNTEDLKALLKLSLKTRVLIRLDQGLAKTIELVSSVPRSLQLLLGYAQRQKIEIERAFLGRLMSAVIQKGSLEALGVLLKFANGTKTWVTQKEGLAEVFHFAIAGEPECVKALCAYVLKNQENIPLEAKLFREMITNLIARAKDRNLSSQSVNDLRLVLDLSLAMKASLGEEFLLEILQHSARTCPCCVLPLQAYIGEYGKLISNGSLPVTLSLEYLDVAMEDLTLIPSYETAQIFLGCVLQLSLDTRVYLEKERLTDWLRAVSSTHPEFGRSFLTYAGNCLKSSPQAPCTAAITSELLFQMIMNLLPLSGSSEAKEGLTLNMVGEVLKFSSEAKVYMTREHLSSVLMQAKNDPKALLPVLSYLESCNIPLDPTVVEEVRNHVVSKTGEEGVQTAYAACRKVLDKPSWEDRLPPEVKSIGSQGQFYGVAVRE